MIVVRECHLCKRTLNQLDDPFSVDCGGDCIVCMAEAGDPECVEGVVEIAKRARPSRVETAGQMYRVDRDCGIVYTRQSTKAVKL